MAVRLGELLLRENRVTPAQLQEALNHQRAHGGRLGSTLIKLGFLDETEISTLLSRHYGVQAIRLEDIEPDPATIKLIPVETAAKYNVVPIGRNGTTLTLAMADPANVFAMDDIKFMTGLHVEPVVAPETAVRDAIARAYGVQLNGSGAKGASTDLVSRALDEFGAEDGIEVVADAEEIDAASLERQSGEAPIIRLVNALMLSAIQKGASDIHIEPYEKDLRIRFRIDGVLHQVMAPALRYRDPICSRVKIMARLDIAEKRLPQDGRIKARFNDRGKLREIDFRVSCIPTLFGEKIVLRLLDPEGLMLDMTKLGFEPDALARYSRAIRKPWGMVLVTGPTGSGKTNTLYS
jgi:type IV pilus assembly protein PilB